MPLECLLHDAALDAFTAAVDQPDLPQPRLVSGGDVLGDDRRDVARREGVQVESAVDWNSCQDGYEAVTMVFMPPRTAKSPTTVMRLG